MADNVTLDAGSGGATAASDDIGGVQYQRVKVTWGTDGTANDTSASAPLPVDLGTDNDVTIDGSGVVQTEDAVHSGGDTGFMMLAVRNDTIASLVSADGDYAPLQVDSDGSLHVYDHNLDSVKGTVGSSSPDDVIVIGAQDSVGNVRQPLILNTSNDAQAETQLALLTTTRMFGYNGSSWDRLRVDGSDNLNVNLNASGTTVTVDATGQGDVPITLAGETVALSANDGVDIGDVDVASLPSDTLVAEGGALGKGVLLQGDDGTDRKNVNVDATTGDVQVDVTNNLTIGSALPAGNNNIGNVDVVTLPSNATVDVNQIGGNAVDSGTGNASAGTQRVVLASDQPALDMSAATVMVDLGANNDVTIDNSSIVHAEDAVHGSGDTGIMTLAVRQDSQTDFGADGDYVPLSINADGELRVTTASGGSGGTSETDDASFTAGTDVGTPMMGFATSDSVDSGDVGVLAMDTARNLKVVAQANDGVDIGDVDVASIAAGSSLIGDVGISGARTSGGTTFFHSNDLDETEESVKGSAGQIYWFHVMNLSSAVIYLQVFNNTSVTVGTTAPDMEFPIATQGDTNGAGFTLSIPNGIEMDTGIIVAATTDSQGSGAPGANEVFINMGYA